MANVWDWTLGYLVVFAVLQFAVYAYYRRQVDDDPTPDPAGGDPAGIDRTVANTSVRSSETTDSRRCPHCGASNEPDSRYRYCRNCTKSLSGA